MDTYRVCKWLSPKSTIFHVPLPSSRSRRLSFHSIRKKGNRERACLDFHFEPLYVNKHKSRKSHKSNKKIKQSYRKSNTKTKRAKKSHRKRTM